MDWYVKVKDWDSDEVVKVMGPMTEAKAHKVAGGIDINLNDDKYYTEVTQDGSD